MRNGTWIALGVLLASLGGLVVSARRAGPAERADGRREVTMLVWGAAEETAELMERVVAPINAASTGPRLRVIPVPADYQTKLCTMIAGAAGPDLFYLSQEHVPAFAAQGALLEISEYVRADGEGACDLDDYYPSVLRMYRHDGKLVGLPWIAQPVVLYCNNRRFAEAGVDLPDGTWTWEQFIEAGRKLTDDLDGDGVADRWGFVLNGWPPVQMWVWQNGAAMVDPATGRLNLREPAVVKALNAYAGLIHEHRIAPPLSVVAEAGLSDLFRSGRSAMFMGGAADNLDRLPGMEVTVAEVPAGPGGRATFAWSAGLHISAAVEDPRAVFPLYQRVLERIHRWKIPAPRRSLAARLEEFEPRKAPAAEVIRRAMETMRPPAASAHHARWETIFAEELLDPLLRVGPPAGPIVERAAPALEAVR